MKNHIFIGGPDDGQTRCVPDGISHYEVTKIPPLVAPSNPENQRIDVRMPVVTYRRDWIETRSGHIAVFTNGVACLPEHLINAYSERIALEKKLRAVLGELKMIEAAAASPYGQYDLSAIRHLTARAIAKGSLQ